MLVLPAFQLYTGIFPEKPLHGAITVPEKPIFSAKTWFDASYQKSYDDYLEQGIGFRSTLIRINNQIAFSVFDTALANGVIIGKKNCLYEYNYIKAYEGIDFSGFDKINQEIEKAKYIQNKLKESGKQFLIVFVPGKASYFPEFIPDKYQVKDRSFTNYDTYTKRCREEGINYLDLNKWFMQMKDTSRYPLYTKAGIHWSLYGVALSVDTLVKVMQRMAGIKMVGYGWDGIELSSKPRETDDDIAQGMNVLFPVKTGVLAYPKIRFDEGPDRVKPNVLVVGDSYYWNIMGSGTAARLFGDNNFWYYNREAHNPAWPEPKKVSDLNLVDVIKKQQFIMLMFTEANLSRFGFGFIDDAYNALQHPEKSSIISPAEKEKRVQEIIADIRRKPDMVKLIRDKSVKNKVSFEKMLHGDATWIFEQSRSK